MESSDLWFPASKRAVEFRRWGDEDSVVVYQVDNGSTHLVSDLGLELLRLLQIAPGSTQTLSAAIGEIFSEESPELVFSYTESCLHDFLSVGLVARTPS